MNKSQRRSGALAVILLASGLAAGDALAELHPAASTSASTSVSASARQYREECGACHIAFPAQALPAPSWQRLMGDLRHHFGADASLDPAATRELSTWLQAHGAVGRWAGTAPPEDRITQTRWFLHEHDELPASTWKRAAVGKPSNCAACHSRASEGRFGEGELAVPR